MESRCLRKEVVAEVQEVVARLAEGGRVMLPLQYCLRAMQGGREDRGVLYLALR